MQCRIAKPRCQTNWIDWGGRRRQDNGPLRHIDMKLFRLRDKHGTSHSTPAPPGAPYFPTTAQDSHQDVEASKGKLGAIPGRLVFFAQVRRYLSWLSPNKPKPTLSVAMRSFNLLSPASKHTFDAAPHSITETQTITSSLETTLARCGQVWLSRVDESFVDAWQHCEAGGLHDLIVIQ